ncbi:DUF6660 family protein [Hymenobacter sp. J193]|uniref:DUF6660 family protein n=1 Tax=Hymenobacter sp. J193 TaxID=2898429 RepID=UPI0035B2099C
MRLFCFLFSLYLACLSCFTCTDEMPERSQQTPTFFVSSSHTDAGDIGDWCSPLCQCHCCGGAIAPAAGLAATAPAKVREWAPATHRLPLTASPLPRASGTVWQPPRA